MTSFQSIHSLTNTGAIHRKPPRESDRPTQRVQYLRRHGRGITRKDPHTTVRGKPGVG
jgi:hypothetical protein